MKKITFLMLHLNYGGLEKQTVTLVNELAKTKEFEIKILSVYDMLNGKSFYPIDDSVSVEFLASFGPNHQKFYDSLRKFNLFSFIKESFIMIKCGICKTFKLKRYIKRLNTDIIVSSRIEFSKLIKRDDTLNISQEHSYIDTEKYIKKVRRSFKHIDKIIVMTNKAKEEYEKWLKLSNSKAQVYNIPNMIEKYELKQGTSFENKTIIGVGRLEKIKDFPMLIDVFNIIHSKDESIKLKIIGEGSQREELEEKITTLKLQDCVTLTGRLEFEELMKEMENASLFLLTSVCESFSLVLCEAMECGLPCISFNIDVGPKEIIENGKNGVLVNNRNANDMAQSALSILEDEKKWRELSRNSIESVKKYYSEYVVKSWLEILNLGGKYEK